VWRKVMAKLRTEPIDGEKEKPAKKKSQTHHERCGDVGETGEHGDLGTNSATHRDKNEDEE
jgi:hypothetical protein